MVEVKYDYKVNDFSWINVHAKLRMRFDGKILNRETYQIYFNVQILTIFAS